MPNQALEKAAKNYLVRFARRRPLSFSIDVEAGQLFRIFEETWLSHENSTEWGARVLRRRAAETMKPLADSVHPGTMLRVMVEISREPRSIPSHDVVPAVSAAFDGKHGHVHHIHSVGAIKDAFDQKIPMGLTISAYPLGLPNEKWTQELGAGGNPYTVEENLRIEARENANAQKTAAADTPRQIITPGRRDPIVAAPTPSKAVAPLKMKAVAKTRSTKAKIKTALPKTPIQAPNLTLG